MGAAPFSLDPALRPWVRSMCAYDLDGYGAGEHIGLPSATVPLVLPTDPLLDLTLAGCRRIMPSCLSGLHDGPATIHHRGTQRGIQVGLTVLGMRQLFGVPASALAHTAVELSDVLGARQADRLLARLHSAQGWPARLTTLQEILRDRIAAADQTPPPRPEVSRAWALVEQSGGTIHIADVALDVGWSRRHLTEQFTLATGLTPKSLARVVRFQRSVHLVASRISISEAATVAGYADQAHLTREWVRLAGTPPGRWPQRDALANVQDRPRN